ncbi:protease modulator HflK [Luteolibacter pohnpeiensis]|uniref:Protease modulator HflK n=1 Tax=Luteolibacter pohnpeiensis TaxID=454153 RepID=A0A934VQE0_9BACT|nr:protease modulator HflK [Luteolibacter pohnpeiensis]MBK1882006.1 protease modulator HflK [Luteolibacter pohnpeiensis]
MSQRRRNARVRSGHALFSAFASTIGLLRWLLAGLGVFYFCSGITRVAPHEDAVIYRFGRLIPDVHPPGLLFALPEPIDRVVRIPTRTQHEVFLRAWAPDEESVVISAGGMPSAPLRPGMIISGVSTATMNSDMAAAADFPIPPGPGLHPYTRGYTLTGDVNLVQARFIARYRITDPISWLSHSSTADAAKFIDASFFDAATRVLAGMSVDDALGAGMESFRTKVLTLAQERLDALKLGVTLVAFEVNTLTPPEATVAAFAEVTSARVESRTLVENARTYRARVIPRAKSDSYRLRSDAEAAASQLLSRASAEAASFLALANEHTAAPLLLESRLKAETLEAVFPQIKTSTILPSDGGSIDLLLPGNP